MNQIEKKVSDLAQPIVLDLGLSLWDVEYTKEAGQWYLRVLVDRAQGVSIEDCEALSRTLDPLLDEKDFIPDSYIFEVGSAGAERQLKRPDDFLQFIGHWVEVKLYQPISGGKEHLGNLRSYDQGNIVIETTQGNLEFEQKDIAMVRLRIV